MKKTAATLLYCISILTSQTSFGQIPAITNSPIPVSKSINGSRANIFFSDPQILSIDLNDEGDKIIKLQQSAGTTILVLADVKSEKSYQIKSKSLGSASQVFFINDQFIALEVHGENSSFEIIEIATNNVLANIPSNKYIGSTAAAAYFSNQDGSRASIEKFDIASKKQSTAGTLTGEVFGWYFSKLKGIVGVAVHRNMVSNIYSFEKEKIGKSLFEFSSGYYFETKGCNFACDVFYGITNFQSITTYSCAISKAGIKPLKNKLGESCTDIFVLGNDVALNTTNINALEYQESQNPTFQKVLTFANALYKGSSVQILDFAEKTNTVLFCVQSEVVKPKYFVWQNNQANPVSSDKFDAKNLVFIASEVVQIETGEVAPQTGRMYLPTKTEKASYPLVIYIPKNIFLPYANQFNPTVQHLCESGYAVFVWNTRYSFRPKIGFAYSDLVGSFPEDIELLLRSLTKSYSLLPENTFIIGESLGGYIALNASKYFTGVVISRLDFPGKKFNQDLTAARMFGEDAQSKWTTLDEMKLSEKSQYLVYSSAKSNAETKLTTSIKQSNIKYTERISSKNNSGKVSSEELEEIRLWLQQLSPIETKGIENKPKADVKTK
jgi:hypothetical protein